MKGGWCLDKVEGWRRYRVTPMDNRARCFHDKMDLTEFSGKCSDFGEECCKLEVTILACVFLDGNV